MAIVLDGLSRRKLLPVDPTGKFPRVFPFIGDFLDFVIKVRSFGIFDNCLEILPIL